MTQTFPEFPIHTLRMAPEAGLPFSLTSFDRTCPLAQLDLPHRHNFYELIFITHGEGTHIIDFEAYSVQPPVLYFLSPGQIHFWQLRDVLEGRIFLFGEEFLRLPSPSFNQIHEFAFFHTSEHASALKLTPEQATGFETLSLSIEREYSSGGLNRESVLRAYFHILLVHIQRVYVALSPAKPLSYESSILRRFKCLLTEQFRTERSVAAYAEQLGITAAHLAKIIKAVTGRPPGQMIRQEIVLEAKRLLAHSDLTAAEIGYHLNFEDPAYFGRFFKRETTMSPSVFRQTIQKKYQNQPK